MARLHATMTTQSLALSASLLTGLGRIFTFSWPVAILFAEMGAAHEWLTANLTAARICEPARHVFHHPLAAQALLLSQEWALGTRIRARVAIVSRLRMATRLGPFTGERARRRLRATWLGRVQDRSSAVTRDLFEDCLSAGIASALVAEFRACVSSAFQRPTTNPRANVLCLDILVERTKMGLELAPHRLTLNGLLFSGTASLSTGVAATMQGCLALAETLGRLDIALVADTQRAVTATLT